jgi:hypothetical protein
MGVFKITSKKEKEEIFENEIEKDFCSEED